MDNNMELEALKWLRSYRDATVAGDYDKMDAAADRFQDVLTQVPSPERRKELRSIYTAVAEHDAESAFEEFAMAAKDFGQVKDAFELGTAMTAAGSAKLFFPTVATELSTFAGAMKSLTDSADTILNSVEGIDESIKKKDVKELIDEGKQAREFLKKFLAKLEKVEKVLPD